MRPIVAMVRRSGPRRSISRRSPHVQMPTVAFAGASVQICSRRDVVSPSASCTRPSRSHFPAHERCPRVVSSAAARMGGRRTRGTRRDRAWRRRCHLRRVGDILGRAARDPIVRARASTRRACGRRGPHRLGPASEHHRRPSPRRVRSSRERDVRDRGARDDEIGGATSLSRTGPRPPANCAHHGM